MDHRDPKTRAMASTGRALLKQRIKGEPVPVAKEYLLAVRAVYPLYRQADIDARLEALHSAEQEVVDDMAELKAESIARAAARVREAAKSKWDVEQERIRKRKATEAARAAGILAASMTPAQLAARTLREANAKAERNTARVTKAQQADERKAAKAQRKRLADEAHERLWEGRRAAKEKVLRQRQDRAHFRHPPNQGGSL
jgi:hypothetical protein